MGEVGEEEEEEGSILLLLPLPPLADLKTKPVMDTRCLRAGRSRGDIRYVARPLQSLGI